EIAVGCDGRVVAVLPQHGGDQGLRRSPGGSVVLDVVDGSRGGMLVGGGRRRIGRGEHDGVRCVGALRPILMVGTGAPDAPSKIMRSTAAALPRVLPCVSPYIPTNCEPFVFQDSNWLLCISGNGISALLFLMSHKSNRP